jgi:transposase
MENGTNNENTGAKVYDAKDYRLFTEEEENGIKTAIVEHKPEDFGINFSGWTRDAVRALIKQEYGIDPALSSITNYMKHWCIPLQRSNAPKHRPPLSRIIKEQLDQKPDMRVDGRLQSKEKQILRRRAIILLKDNGFTYGAISQIVSCSSQYISHIGANWNKGGAAREKVIYGRRLGGPERMDGAETAHE